MASSKRYAGESRAASARGQFKAVFIFHLTQLSILQIDELALSIRINARFCWQESSVDDVKREVADLPAA